MTEELLQQTHGHWPYLTVSLLVRQKTDETPHERSIIFRSHQICGLAAILLRRCVSAIYWNESPHPYRRVRATIAFWAACSAATIAGCFRGHQEVLLQWNNGQRMSLHGWRLVPLRDNQAGPVHTPTGSYMCCLPRRVSMAATIFLYFHRHINKMGIYLNVPVDHVEPDKTCTRRIQTIP